MSALFELRKTCRGGPMYDTAYHMIILADNEEEARELAQREGLDECFDYSRGFRERRPMPFWTDPTKTSCKIFSMKGPSRVVCMRTLDG